MCKLAIETDAQNDIRLMIANGDSKAATRIVAFLQELKADQRFLSELLTRNFGNDRFHVDKLISFHDDGLNIWRVKFYEFDFDTEKKYTMPYRVIYGYDQKALTFRILGIMPRSYNYEPEHEFTKRIRRCYDELGLPKYRIGSARSTRN